MNPKIIFTTALFAFSLFSVTSFSQSVLNDDFYNNNASGSFNRTFNTKAKVIQTSAQAPGGFYLGQVSQGEAGSVNELYFSLPERQQVRITLMDMMGQEIDEIINRDLSEGTYKISYDVSKLSAGVYSYRLQTEGYSEMKKMLVIK